MNIVRKLMLLPLVILAACTAMSSVPLRTNNNTTGITYNLPKFLYHTKVVVSYAGGPAGAEPPHDDEHRVVDVLIDPPTAVPDTNHRYLLKFKHSILSEDDYTATTDASGLLVGITSITDDKSLEILKKIAELVKEIAKLSVQVEAVPGLVFEGDIDPSPNGVGQAKLIEILGKYKATIKFDPVTKVAQDANAKITPAVADCSVGICYRPLDEFLVTMTLPQQGISVFKQMHLFAPNSASMVAVAIDRAAFVKRETRMTFVNGALTELKDKTPSEVLALVTAPIEIVKTVASIPKDILTLRTERVNDESGLLRAEAAKIRAEADLIKALQELKNSQPQ